MRRGFSPLEEVGLVSVREAALGQQDEVGQDVACLFQQDVRSGVRILCQLVQGGEGREATRAPQRVLDLELTRLVALSLGAPHGLVEG